MSRAERRLAVTVVSDADAIWGSERSMLNLAPHLTERGVDLTVAAPAGAFTDAARELGLRHVPLVLPPRGGERTAPLRDLLRDAMQVPRGVARVVRATRGADVVHSNNLLAHPDTALAGRLTRRSTVLELHDIVTGAAPVLLQSVAVALSSATVSISRATSETVRGPGRRRVHLVPQAVDLTRFTPGDGDGGALRRAAGDPPVLVGIVGRVDPAKGVDVLVRAAARAGEDVGVVVIGSPGGDAGGYLAQVRELGAELLGPRFHWAGPTDDVPRALRSLDVLVNASEAEPFGLSILEAQACGVPVIGTAAGGIPDFVESGRTGVLVPPHDVEALAVALQRLASDADLRRQLAADALTAARAAHGIGTRADALAALYRSVARRGQSPPSPSRPDRFRD